MDLKKEYIEDVKNIVSLNSNEKTEKLSSLIEKQNEVLIEKTSSIINDVVPKNQESYNKVLNETLRTFQTNLTEDTKNLLNSGKAETIACTTEYVIPYKMTFVGKLTDWLRNSCEFFFLLFFKKKFKFFSLSLSLIISNTQNENNLYC